jgi:hypothetical protein
MLSNTIWNAVGTGSIGDPIVQYDHDAERWLIMELQGIFTNELLIAISNTSDPTGGWKAYRFQTQGFGDYPKLYVWHNAYFITVNEISNGNHCSGYALERAAMLAGEPTFDLYRFEMPNYMAIAYQPATGADWEGGPPPPAGSPAYIFRVYDDGWDGGQDHLQIWEVDVDWDNASQSSITGPDKCSPPLLKQKSVLEEGCLTALNNLMQVRPALLLWKTSSCTGRLTAILGLTNRWFLTTFRTFLVRSVKAATQPCAGTNSASKAAAIGKYIRKAPMPRIWLPTVFMGTICTDEAGNIALGYSGASEFLYPGLYLTGRRNSDPLGDMPVEEYTLAAGEQSHQGDNRWGDYSNMSVDPEDGRTFWFTGEYQPAGAPWGTRIGSFKMQVDTYDIKPLSLLTPVSSALLGNGEPVKVKIYNGGLVPVTGFTTSLYFEGNLVATENVSNTIQPGESVDHLFAATVDMPVVGKNYNFRIITNWLQDQFVRNDTLDAVIQKLTSNDVAAVGKYNLPGLVCGSETDFGIIIRNASGLPLNSAKVHWRINNQPYNIYDWTGNLPAGESDTIDLHATNILNGLNNLRIHTSLPNGVQDERTSNDSLAPSKFLGNLDGTYLIAEAETTFGVLAWELRSETNVLLAAGEMSAGQTFTQICSDDNTCYRVILKSSTFSWQGHFRLYSIFGDIMVEAFDAIKEESQIFNICTPQRQQIDVGALALVTPASGPNLTVAEPIKIRFRNFGLTDQANIEVAYKLNGGAWKSEVYPGIVASGATIEHTFSTTEDLSTLGASYNFELSATIPGDEKLDNDTLHTTVRNRALRELEITNVHTVQACSDSSFVFVGVSVRNNGIGDNHQFDIQITVNGVPQPTVPQTVTIAPDASLEIPLFIQGVQFGQNTVAVDLTNVDGQGEDEQPGNDTGSVTFELHPDGYGVQMFFATNGFPEENRWELRDDQGNLVKSGGPYPGAFTFYSEELCLEQEKCYVFHLFDSGGNGMEGGIVDLFSPIAGTHWSYAGDDFGSEISAPFCAVALCADFFVDAAAVNPSSQGSSDGQITALPSDGLPPYQFNLNGGNYQADPLFSNLPSGFYVLGALDANGCFVETFVSLGTVAINEPAQLRKLKVSPNPTSGMATIELPAIEGEQSLMFEVFDLKGKLVQTARLVRWDNTLRGMVILDNAPAGTYFVRVKDLARPLTARLVKK